MNCQGQAILFIHISHFSGMTFHIILVLLLHANDAYLSKTIRMHNVYFDSFGNSEWEAPFFHQIRLSKCR